MLVCDKIFGSNCEDDESRRNFIFFFSSRRRHTRSGRVTGVQTCALPICFSDAIFDLDHNGATAAKTLGIKREIGCGPVHG